MPQISRRLWSWRFEAPRERVWPALADTARFNEAAGFPKHVIDELPQPDGSVVYVGHARFGPFEIGWRDLPVDWVANQRFRHAREFENGPFRSLVATLELAEEGDGCRANYTLEVEPANLLGRLMLAAGFMRQTGKTLHRLVADAAAFARGETSEPYRYRPAALSGAARTRLETGLAELKSRSTDPALADRLGAYLVDGAELDLMHLRPRRLARLWGVPERAAIELCLTAAKGGLLELQWDLLCPNCRGAKTAVVSLDRLPNGVHCGTCNIDYGRDFMRNVELTFRPSPAIRPITAGEFCLFGPMSTPHVAIQQTLAAGESRDVPAVLGPGSYRLRLLHPAGSCDVEYSSGGIPTLIADSDRVLAGDPSPPGFIRLVNRRDRPATAVVESREWVKDALTAHRAISLQAFRDLFPREILRPGDEVSIGHVTLMFTDLRGSTALYSRIGDARAYGLVRDHFAYLGAAVRAHDGAIIKTIGDAVMAAFADPADALAAALDVQRNVARFNANHAGGAASESIVIKLGLHAGPCIAVTLNDRLDYFGSTVNMAARLQGESRGGDIVVSETVAEDPAVTASLGAMATTRESATIKGFAQPVPFRRLSPDAAATV
ncbi:MAG TPA: adenylate/guanylate cyclase domain-containing protein [Alphaproteobacteria bacterium]|nr:adenylate/guanylate cyclase domain-containing protein [Alphaproteobacteria bacterium]